MTSEAANAVVNEHRPTLPRRNTYSETSINRSSSQTSSRHYSRASSGEDNSVRNNALNSFNDLGHLSRRIFNDDSVSHLKSQDFKNTFGYRMLFNNQTEVTAINASTIAMCLSSIICELVVMGEKLWSGGHNNGENYDIFCGGGKSSRMRPHSEEELGNNLSLAVMDKVPGLREPLPSVQQIKNFVAKICVDTQTEYECIIIALIYARRLIKSSNGKLVLLRENWKGVILSCIMLSNKVWDDFHMRNADYCKVFKGLTIDRVNTLELQLLICLENRCNVSPSVYAQTHFEIQSMITLKNIERDKPQQSRKIFASDIGKVYALEDNDVFSSYVSHDAKVKHIKNMHPMPYKSMDMDNMPESPGDNDSDDSAHLSAPDDQCIKLRRSIDNYFGVVELQSKDSEGHEQSLENVDHLENINMRVEISYQNKSLIKSPSKAVVGKANISPAAKHLKRELSRSNSLKLPDQHARKAYRGHSFMESGDGDYTAGSCLPFFHCLCFAKVHDI